MDAIVVQTTSHRSRQKLYALVEGGGDVVHQARCGKYKYNRGHYAIPAKYESTATAIRGVRRCLALERQHLAKEVEVLARTKSDSITEVTTMSKILLLPAALGAVSKFAERKDGGARWACTGVSLETKDDGTFTAAATNTKYLCVVEGKSDDPDEYPIGDALDAIKGETPKSALIPAKAWDDMFKAANAVKGVKPILNSVAVKLGEKSAGMHVTDLEVKHVKEAQYLEGRFPPWRDIFPKSKPKFTISFDPHFLAHVCAGVAKIIGGVEPRIDVDIWHHEKPVVVRCQSEALKVRALLMPLVGGGASDDDQTVNNEVYGECLDIIDKAYENDNEHGDHAALSAEMLMNTLNVLHTKLNAIYVGSRATRKAAAAHPPTGVPVDDDDADDSDVDSDVEAEAGIETDVEEVLPEKEKSGWDLASKNIHRQTVKAAAVANDDEPDLDAMMSDMLDM